MLLPWLLQVMLFLAGCCFMLGAALQAGASNLAMLIAGRVVLGLGVGVFPVLLSALFLTFLICFCWALERGVARG